MMDNFIKNDAFKFCIKPLLYPIDLYHLLISCKLFVKHFDIEDIKINIIIQIEKELLELFGIHYDRFNKLFDEQDSIITGPIILRSIYGKKSFNGKVKICMFTNENVFSNWRKFVAEIDSTYQNRRSGNTEIIICEKMKIIFIDKRQHDNRMRNYYSKFCYKGKNRLSIQNIQFFLERQLDANIFMHNVQSFLKYHKEEFKFYGNSGILSNNEICDMLLRRESTEKISKCKYIDACFEYETKYYKLFDCDCNGITKIVECDTDSPCFIHILSPDTKHFHIYEYDAILLVVDGII